jgi:hypothetical protein
VLRFGAMATKRPENLMPGDRVLVWERRVLVVESAQPSVPGDTDPYVRVDFVGGAVTRYQPGVLIETADD